MVCSHVCDFLLPLIVSSQSLSDSRRHCGGNRVGGRTPAARIFTAFRAFITGPHLSPAPQNALWALCFPACPLQHGQHPRVVFLLLKQFHSELETEVQAISIHIPYTRPSFHGCTLIPSEHTLTISPDARTPAVSGIHRR
jgi:hypothetical protein